MNDALDYLNDLIEGKNANYQTYFKRSEVYFQLEDNRRALIDIQKSLELNPTYEEAYLLQSQIYFKQGKFEKCISAALQAELRGLRNYELYQLLAKAYLEENEVENAQKSIQRLLDFNKSAENLSLKGDIYLELKDTAVSINSYESAIEANELLVKPYRALYAIYEKSDLDKSEMYLDKYLTIDSSQADFLVLKGDILAKRGAYDSAIYLYEMANVGILPDKDVINKLAKYYYEMDSLKVAQKWLRRSLQLDSISNRQAMLLMARSLDRARLYEESKEYYASLIQIDSTDVIANEELNKLNRKIAYLWRLKQQEKAFDSIRNSAPPAVERKEVNQ